MVNGKKVCYDDLIVIKSVVPDEVFSKRGDSGSLVTLTGSDDDDDEEIQEGKAVSMVFAGKKSKIEKNENKGDQNGGEEKVKESYTFPLLEAIDILLEKNNIENNYVILSKFVSKIHDEENAYVEPSSETNEVSKGNFNNVRYFLFISAVS